METVEKMLERNGKRETPENSGRRTYRNTKKKLKIDDERGKRIETLKNNEKSRAAASTTKKKEGKLLENEGKLMENEGQLMEDEGKTSGK